MGLANYNNVQKITVFFPTVTRLALNIFFFLWWGAQGVAKKGKRGGRTSREAVILEEPLFFYIVSNPLPR